MPGGLDPTTPQLKLVKNFFDAYCTLDVTNVGAHISKDYKFQTFPEIAHHPDEARDAHFERYGKLLSSMKKLELTYHEVIEAPGKVVLQLSAELQTILGVNLDYDSVAILTIVEEDGALKISNFKDFSNPEKRSRLHGWALNTLAGLAP